MSYVRDSKINKIWFPFYLGKKVKSRSITGKVKETQRKKTLMLMESAYIKSQNSDENTYENCFKDENPNSQDVE